MVVPLLEGHLVGLRVVQGALHREYRGPSGARARNRWPTVSTPAACASAAPWHRRTHRLVIVLALCIVAEDGVHEGERLELGGRLGRRVLVRVLQAAGGRGDHIGCTWPASHTLGDGGRGQGGPAARRTYCSAFLKYARFSCSFVAFLSTPRMSYRDASPNSFLTLAAMVATRTEEADFTAGVVRVSCSISARAVVCCKCPPGQ